MADKTLEEKVNEIHNTVLEIKAVLFGMTGNPNGGGLFREFRQHIDSDKAWIADYEQFKRKVIAIFAFIVGSGILGGGIFGLLKLV